jgi:hypothetical protein
MIIQNLEAFKGQHCETTATGTLLYQQGIYLSEPMLFGLGEGLSFIFWSMKGMDFPFMGGRVKPDMLTQNIARNLCLKLEVKETSSVQKAWQMVHDKIEDNIAVGLKLDAYHLDYFTRKIHFAAHYVAMYGFDDINAYLIDTLQQGCSVRTSLKSLELARNEKGAMSSRNLMYTIQKCDESLLKDSTIIDAIKSNAREYLNPPISNISYQGIQKAAYELKKWFKTSRNLTADFKTMAMLMEKAGTGGALFRNFYRDFLKEAAEILNNSLIKDCHSVFTEIAMDWNKVSGCFTAINSADDYGYIEEASDVLIKISAMERKAMENLEAL